MDSALFDYYEDREAQTVELVREGAEQDAEIAEAEERHDPTRLCWANIDGDDNRCKILTGFICGQFLELFDICEGAMPVTLGRGRRSKISNHDKLLLALCYLKHYETKEKLQETFAISKTQIHRNLDTTIKSITPVLYQRYIENIYTLIDPDVDQNNFPDAKFVMDTTTQEIWTPIGTYNERKRYYSGKHKMYGLKSQTLHNRRGFTLHFISGIPGAMHDLTIARQYIDVIRPFLIRPREGDDIDSDGEWSILVDSGYKGLDRLVSAVIPYKKPIGGILDREQRNFNRALATQRVICERWYGRLKTKFRIMSSKYRNSRDDYGIYFSICAALTNYSMIHNPL